MELDKKKGAINRKSQIIERVLTSLPIAPNHVYMG